MEKLESCMTSNGNLVRRAAIFTHIPKTAGTSFYRGVLFTNYGEEHVLGVRGLEMFLRADKGRYDAFMGHFPFGLHLFLREKAQYVTFLREPVDHAVSMYHFVKDCDRTLYEHPWRADADRLAIGEFYRLRKYRNVQTRYLAGFWWDRIYPWLPEFMDRWVLKAALRHLRKYYLVGFQESYDADVERICGEMGWRQEKTERMMKTACRPKLEEISTGIREVIQTCNRLDMELYRVARAASGAG